MPSTMRFSSLFPAFALVVLAEKTSAYDTCKNPAYCGYYDGKEWGDCCPGYECHGYYCYPDSSSGKGKGKGGSGKGGSGKGGSGKGKGGSGTCSEDYCGHKDGYYYGDCCDGYYCESNYCYPYESCENPEKCGYYGDEYWGDCCPGYECYGHYCYPGSGSGKGKGGSGKGGSGKGGSGKGGSGKGGSGKGGSGKGKGKGSSSTDTCYHYGEHCYYDSDCCGYMECSYDGSDHKHCIKPEDSYEY